MRGEIIYLEINNFPSRVHYIKHNTCAIVFIEGGGVLDNVGNLFYLFGIVLVSRHFLSVENNLTIYVLWFFFVIYHDFTACNFKHQYYKLAVINDLELIVQKIEIIAIDANVSTFRTHECSVVSGNCMNHAYQSMYFQITTILVKIINIINY